MLEGGTLDTMYYFTLVKEDMMETDCGVLILLQAQGCPVDAGETGERLSSKAVGILIPPLSATGVLF